MAKVELDVAEMVEETFEKHFGVTLDRLRELAEADKDRRCVVLPCKAGGYYPEKWFYVMQNTIFIVKRTDAMRPVAKYGIRKFYSTIEAAESALKAGDHR